MICACWDYTISRRTPWGPRTPLLVGSLPTPAPNKMDGNLKKTCDERLQKNRSGSPTHFPTALARGPCTFCQATPTNSIINKNAWYHKKPVEIQSTHCLNDSSELSNCCSFITFRQSNIITENQIHSLFWSLMSKEQYIKNSCIDLWNTQWIKRCFPVWIFQCHANNVQNRGLTFHEILIASWQQLYFQNTRFFPTSMPASQCIGRVAPKWSQLMQRGR